ncbi:hypothetical protein [Sulfurovum sp.]|uniref:hypothetical protein n=1 Tax=Sulfurovum sp. TaxID=1969726 RepID=UPI0025F59DAC|nr:hypothetical protein [Sulfurovum sp.]
MLQYRQRNSVESVPGQQGRSVHTFVGFCNYSYDRRRHIDTSMLCSFLSSFNEANPALLR